MFTSEKLDIKDFLSSQDLNLKELLYILQLAKRLQHLHLFQGNLLWSRI